MFLYLSTWLPLIRQTRNTLPVWLHVRQGNTKASLADPPINSTESLQNDRPRKRGTEMPRDKYWNKNIRACNRVTERVQDCPAWGGALGGLPRRWCLSRVLKDRKEHQSHPATFPVWLQVSGPSCR